MATELMSYHRIQMHGPEHHYLVPAVLLTAILNVRCDTIRKPELLREARRRAEQIAGGLCGSHGACGAAIGAGICTSILLHATPLSREEWRLSNLITATALLAIADLGGPRCCKRDTFLALETAAQFAEQHLDASLPRPKDFTCAFSAANHECLLHRCPFHPANSL
jgi:hypothetical protein